LVTVKTQIRPALKLEAICLAKLTAPSPQLRPPMILMTNAVFHIGY